MESQSESFDRDVLDEDGEVVGQVYFVYVYATGYWYQAHATYEDDRRKVLSRHRTIEEAENEIRRYWGMT